MSRYLDTNAIIGLLTADPLTARVSALLRQSAEPLIFSDFAAAEFSAVVGRKMRIGTITRRHALDALATLDQWSARVLRIEIEAGDISRADSFLRRLDLPLLAPDAIHVAIVQRLGATLVTFDQRMASAARRLGLPVSGA
ncbi:MAG TPA: type II toxin-antitoxin system VapC family toxin [Stellaceae bacterium]|nr:type II toxin-antitoxin system VapC family toxin [Stellaceae bacterium]